MKIILFILFLITVAFGQTYENGYKAAQEDSLKESKLRIETLELIEKINTTSGGERASHIGAFRAKYDFLCVYPVKFSYNKGYIGESYFNGYVKGCEDSLFKK